MSKVQRKTDIATEATRHYSTETQIPQVLSRQRERERERERETDTDRQTDRQRETERTNEKRFY